MADDKTPNKKFYDDDADYFPDKVDHYEPGKAKEKPAPLVEQN